MLLYGHLDKQPEMTGWRDGLGPWTPVREGDRLYGRGGADDGYAVFASLTAIAAVQAAGEPHARCVVLIEASEESSSPDLPAYVEALADRLGAPDLVVCLDSGAIDDRRLWAPSLRGIASASSPSGARRRVHSGARAVWCRRACASCANSSTASRARRPGPCSCGAHVEIPTDRRAEAAATAAEIADPFGDE